MSLENGKCPNCGGAANLDNSKEKFICRYCGAEMVILDAIKKCQIDGIATFDSLLLQAEQAIKYDGDYDKALKKYKEALNLRPDDYRVLWGIYLCEMDSIAWYARTKGFVQFPGDVQTCIVTAKNKWGSRAVDSAPEEVGRYYQEKLYPAPQQAAASKSEKSKWWRR